MDAHRIVFPGWGLGLHPPARHHDDVARLPDGRLSGEKGDQNGADRRGQAGDGSGTVQGGLVRTDGAIRTAWSGSFGPAAGSKRVGSGGFDRKARSKP